MFFSPRQFTCGCLTFTFLLRDPIKSTSEYGPPHFDGAKRATRYSSIHMSTPGQPTSREWDRCIRDNQQVRRHFTLALDLLSSFFAADVTAAMASTCFLAKADAAAGTGGGTEPLARDCDCDVDCDCDFDCDFDFDCDCDCDWGRALSGTQGGGAPEVEKLSLRWGAEATEEGTGASAAPEAEKDCLRGAGERGGGRAAAFLRGDDTAAAVLVGAPTGSGGGGAGELAVAG